MGRSSVFGIATRHGLEGTGSNPGEGENGPGAHPAPYTMGTGKFPGIKRPGRGVDHIPPLEPRLKKQQGYTSTPLQPGWSVPS